LFGTIWSIREMLCTPSLALRLYSTFGYADFSSHRFELAQNSPKKWACDKTNIVQSGETL